MADYQGVLADLRAKLDALDAERDKLRIVIETIDSMTAPGLPGLQLREPVVPSGRGYITEPLVTSRQPYAGLTMRQAITSFFELGGDEPRSTAQVADVLKLGGMKSDSASYQTQVYNTLKDMKDKGQIHRTPDGRWTRQAV